MATGDIENLKLGLGHSAEDFQNVLGDMERSRAEAALRESEARFRAVFETMIEACCIFEMIYDDLGKPVDWKILEANAGYERQSGLKNVAGKLASEVMPGTEPYWIETFGRVAETGEAEQIERWHQPTGRWIHSSTARVGGTGSRRLVSVFYDITERKQAEFALRDKEERQAFLLKLSDALRAERDEDAVINRAIQIVGAHLAVDRCYACRFAADAGLGFLGPEQHGPGLAPVSGTYRFADFPNVITRVRTDSLIIHDVSNDAALTTTDRQLITVGLGVRAMMAAVFRRGQSNLAWGICVAQAVPRRWTDAEVVLVEEASERTWAAMERTRAEAALRESEQRFQQFAASSSDALWIRDATTFAFEYASPALESIFGVTPEAVIADARLLNSLIVPEERGAISARIERIARGEPLVLEYRILRASDHTFRWIRSTGFPLHDAEGRVTRIAAIASDVTEAKLSAEHQGVLLSELQHRVRNIMAMIRSIAARTGDGAQTVPQYAELITGRLLALARVQALLTRAANVSVGVAMVVRDEVAAQAQHEGQYVLEGPDIVLSPKAAEVLTLAVHELSTNALKYGALSVPDGKVTVRWCSADRRGTPWLVFDWTEEGAPQRGSTGRRGFGSELIEGRIPYELRGTGAITIELGGARCHLEFPLKEGASVLETGAPQRTTVFGGSLDMSGGPDLSGARVLMVEDDYYLAMDTARALRGAGADVMGPYSSEADARAALDRQRPHAAVVDINLGAGPSFQLADSLRQHCIPFVFTTGYDQEVIPQEFSSVERLVKPIQARDIVGIIAKLVTDTA